MRTLVVYYSRTGNTGTVATQLARALGADLERIVDPTPREGIVGYLRSGYDSVAKRAAPIAAALKDPRDYDLVVIGSPVWAGNVSSPVRAYLQAMRGRLPAVAFFCTMGGRGSDGAFATMTDLCGARPVAKLALQERSLTTLKTLEEFAAAAGAVRARAVETAPSPVAIAAE